MESIQQSLSVGIFHQLNWADYILLFIIFLSTLISIIRGFLREIISLTSWILAFWTSLKFSQWLSEHLINIIPHQTLRKVAAIVILLIIVLLAGMIIAHCIDKIIKKGKLSTLDRMLGMCFGMIRGFLIAALLLFFGQIISLEKNKWWQESSTIPLLKKPVEILQQHLPKQIEKISIMSLLNNKKVKHN